MKRLLSFIAIFLMYISSHAAPSWYARMSADTLTIGNTLIERTFLWNGGNLKTLSLKDLKSGVCHKTFSVRPDLQLIKSEGPGQNGKFDVAEIAQDEVHHAHLQVTVSFSIEALNVKRVFRIYDDVPAIACDTWLNGALGKVASSSAVILINKLSLPNR